MRIFHLNCSLMLFHLILTFNFSLDVAMETQLPTRSPSPHPTQSPTHPTLIPTPFPTFLPTKHPTTSPTSSPTLTCYNSLQFILSGIPYSLYTPIVLDAIDQSISEALNIPTSLISPAIASSTSSSLRTLSTPSLSTSTPLVLIAVTISTTSTLATNPYTQSDQTAALYLTHFTANLPIFLSTFKRICNFFTDQMAFDSVQQATVSPESVVVSSLVPSLQPSGKAIDAGLLSLLSFIPLTLHLSFALSPSHTHCPSYLPLPGLDRPPLTLFINHHRCVAWHSVAHNLVCDRVFGEKGLLFR